MGSLPCGEAQEYQAVFSVPYQPGTLEVAARRNGAETGRDILRTAGETAGLALYADMTAPQDGGEALCFLTIQAVDKDGAPAFDESGEVKVKLSGGRLLALGSADPKPDLSVLYHSETCPLYEGTALAVILGTGGDCAVEATMGNSITTRISVPFARTEPEKLPVHDVRPGPLDLPLGELMANKAALAVLEKFISPVVNNPMAGAMAGMSLKKIFSMSGQPIPAGLEAELIAAMSE